MTRELASWILLALTVTVPLSAFSTSPAQHPQLQPADTALPLLQRMEAGWERVRDYTAILEKHERMTDGRTVRERGLIKFLRPDFHYLGVHEGPNAGAQLLYPAGGNRDRALAHDGGLLNALAHAPVIGAIIPREFDIRDPAIMRSQHHTITDSTLGGMLRLIGRNLRLAAELGEGQVRIHGSEQVDRAPALKLEVRLPANSIRRHTVAVDESLWDIAHKHRQDMHVILYNNPELRDPARVEAGQTVIVPRYYAPRSYVWISDTTDLPVKLEIYDRHGRLYEAYLHTELRLNTGLTVRDFAPVNYGF